MNRLSTVSWLMLPVFGWMFVSPTTAVAMELEGYTEPYRTIEVATDEMGTVDDVLVTEGQAVEKGAPLLRLNSEVYDALLAIAEQNMNARGRLDAAKAELQLRNERLRILHSLRSEGHARQEEVDRAASETSVADANYRAVQEDLVARRLEYEKIKAQINRRTIRAPIAGVVSTVHKQKGEFVAPNSPETLTLVQIDTLLACFTLTSKQAAGLQIDDSIEITFTSNNAHATGNIEFISPVTDAKSGTVLVKVRIDNSNSAFRSGERCRIQIGS